MFRHAHAKKFYTLILMSRRDVFNSFQKQKDHTWNMQLSQGVLVWTRVAVILKNRTYKSSRQSFEIQVFFLIFSVFNVKIKTSTSIFLDFLSFSC